jgi:diguanylate cyclase (GGDEF)-like protein
MPIVGKRTMESIGELVDAEIAKIIADRMRMTTLTSVLGYGLQAFILKDYVPHAALVLWLVAVACAEAINYSLASHADTPVQQVGTRMRYLRLQMAGVLLSGSCWGISVFLPGLWEQPIALMPHLFILVLVTVFAIHNMCLRWEILAAFSLGMLGPTLLLSAYNKGGYAPKVIAALLIAFCMVQIYGYFSRRLHTKQIMDHFEMQKLTQQMAHKNEELVRLIEVVERLASHDPLTNCLNRRALSQRYHKLMDRSISSTPLGIIMVDADNFKAINDQHGHDAGDQVLVAMVGRISSQLRASDSLARWGGEEFLCVLPGVQMDGLLERAERIRAAIAEHPVTWKTHRLQATASLGVALLRRQESFEEAVHRADQALYHAKHAGRNQVSYKNPP